jgi:multimeric flavodoxin WrbA|nr:NAD(P)H-dependent oxidoreductase [uncultured Acetatifactor sp.]
MKILVLNGSPRPKGNTAALVDAFVEGAKENGHDITVVAEEKLTELKQFGKSLKNIAEKNEEE